MGAYMIIMGMFYAFIMNCDKNSKSKLRLGAHMRVRSILHSVVEVKQCLQWISMRFMVWRDNDYDGSM